MMDVPVAAWPQESGLGNVVAWHSTADCTVHSLSGIGILTMTNKDGGVCFPRLFVGNLSVGLRTLLSEEI